jgi:flagella basal body P-ring formation protein FlgA
VRTLKIILAILACSASAVDALRAAEIRLKPQARTSASVVTLGDVADVFAADAFQTEQLRGIELGPAPASGRRRYIRVREVQDAVWTRGINLSLHQFSGVEQTEVTGPVDAADVEAAPAFHADPAERERAERTVSNLILQYLRKQTNPREPFQIALNLTDPQIEAVLAYGSRLAVEGGAAPWVGPQQFTFGLVDGKTPVRFTVDAMSTLPPGVVVVTKPLSAGSIVCPTDVELRSPTGVNASMQPFRRIEDVVGQETTWSIPAGTVLTPQSVRRPIVVRRGQPITVYARSAGLRVRTTAKAREDGGLGDLITVEPLQSREAFYARVTGVQEAEVFAAPAAAAPSYSPSAAATSLTLGAPATPAYPTANYGAPESPATVVANGNYNAGNYNAAATAHPAGTYPNAQYQPQAILPATAYQGGR